jgi:hypothetical protein
VFYVHPLEKSEETPALNTNPNDEKSLIYKMKKSVYSAASKVYLTPCTASLQKVMVVL